jgi:hypothetical protein
VAAFVQHLGAMLDGFAKEGEHFGIVLEEVNLKMPWGVKTEKAVADSCGEGTNTCSWIKQAKCCRRLGREEARHERADLRRREKLPLFLAIV